MSLEMEHVSVSIGKKEILHDITLNIQEGEFDRDIDGVKKAVYFSGKVVF